MELLKVTHPNAEWQLINPGDFDPEIHQLYEESAPKTEDESEESEDESEKSDELPPETPAPNPSPRKRK